MLVDHSDTVVPPRAARLIGHRPGGVLLEPTDPSPGETIFTGRGWGVTVGPGEVGSSAWGLLRPRRSEGTVKNFW